MIKKRNGMQYTSATHHLVNDVANPNMTNNDYNGIENVIIGNDKDFKRNDNNQYNPLIS